MTSTPALMEAVAGRSKELGTGVHIHLAEHLAEVAHCLTNYKMRPAQWFDHFDLLGPNLIAAHSVRLSDQEVLLISERGANPCTATVQPGQPRVQQNAALHGPGC